MNRLVVTADDFGLAREVNEAVEIAHRKGILSAASLMVAAPEAQDAVSRARSMPNLRVGLHLALTDALPALPPEKIPQLVDRAGRLRADLARLGFDLAVDRDARRQMRAEIEAQFAAFRATGLALDHVNVHQHFHLHPVVAAMVIGIGRAYRMRALRAPYEPRRMIALADESSAPAYRAVEQGCAAWLRRLAKRAGLATADGVLGLRWSGCMTAQRLQSLLSRLPPGFWEIYLHPATRDAFPGCAPGYRYVDELAALVDPLSIEALRRAGRSIGGYGDLPG
ncbi:MAG TPA: hopanoid biosynthesis-associated protein HpnK [Roseiarcus sp.]|nr:hopanoid biosynthesis-associated protein HpnK [Roseiarcus sp.]